MGKENKRNLNKRRRKYQWYKSRNE